MAIEPAVTISGPTGFVITNPTDNDPLQQGAQQLRLVKSVLQATFPNVTAPVTATAAQLNTIGSALAGNILTVPAGTTAGDGGHVILAGQGASPLVSLVNTSGTLQAYSGASVAASLTPAGAFAALLSVSAPSIQKNGAELLPPGIICMWSGSVASIPAGWHLCDGTAGTPDLRGIFVLGAGGSYSPGQTGGQFSASAVTDTQGSHSHTGSTGAAYGGVTLTGTTDFQGQHGHTNNTLGHSLTVSEMAPHTHTIEMGFGTGGSAPVAQASTALVGGYSGVVDTQGGGAAHTHGISSDGQHNHNVSVGPTIAHSHSISVDGAHAHNVTVNATPPYYALALIMKL